MMPERIPDANDALLEEIVHKHRVLRSASMIDIGKSFQNTAAIGTQNPLKRLGKRQTKY
jgi:hypothetical protein